MITIIDSPNAGYFRVDGIDYAKNQYVIEYDNKSGGESVRNFSLVSIVNGDKIIKSRGYAEVNGVTSWDELSQLLYLVNAIAINEYYSQDQSSPVIIASFSKEEQSTTLSAPSVVDSNDITVVDATGFIAGKYVSIFSIPDNRFYLGSVINVLANVITLDTPLDFTYPIGAFVTCGERNMNVDGSSTPVIFGVRNTDEQIGSTFDVTRIMFHCLADSTVDLSKFGDIIGGLEYGIVIRKVDGVQRNILNAKTNGELKTLMQDFDIETVQGNQQDGFTGRLTFAGDNKLGVVIKLRPGEDLQLIVQDNQTSLQFLGITLEGHIQKT